MFSRIRLPHIGQLATFVGTLAIASFADAQVTDLFFSEYVEGSSNNKALEIYNGTGAAIDLADGGYRVEMYSNGSATASVTISLVGTVASGDVFVLTHALAALPGITSNSDQANSAGWYNGDDNVVLRKGSQILDWIGVAAVDPGTEWGTGLTSTADNTLRRKSTVCQGDTTNGDAFDPATEWDGFATDTVSGLGSHTANCGNDTPPTVTATDPLSGSIVAASANLTVTFSEAVTVSANWYTLSCSLSALVPGTTSGSGNARTIDPNLNLQAGESCTLTVLADQVADVDATATNMQANQVVSFSVQGASACGQPATPINVIQGASSSTSMADDVVEIEGVVVGDFQGGSTVGLGGFFVQEDDRQDANPDSSEGIFVFDGPGNVAVQVGDLVRVRGRVTEYFELTELTDVSSVTVCSSENPLPAPVAITLPLPEPTSPGISQLERWEGMRVSVSGPNGAPLAVTETYTNGQFGEVVLATSAQFIPTQRNLPGSAAAIAEASLNARSRIQLDDGRSAQNPLVPSPIPYVGPNGTLRRGDTLTLGNLPAGQRVLTGVLSYGFESYELHPTVAIDPSSWTTTNPRPPVPSTNGRLKVATFNVLNYFKTIDTLTATQCAQQHTCCGPDGSLECRGCQNANECSRQEAKIQAALKALDADVVALNEVENNALSGPRASELALQGLVDLLNTAPNAAGTYAYVATGTIGSDAIKVGFLYKPAKVESVGSHQVLDDSDCSTYADHRNRPALAQTFRERASGARFTAVAVHLKSKGSSCSSDGDPVDPNGQGECNGTRTAAVQCIASWLASDPTQSGDPRAVVLGDFNAYGREQPITTLESLGYEDEAATRLGDGSYDYTFQGEAGALTHAIANPAIKSQVVDATVWHINSDEPRAFDYNDFNQPAAYVANEFRSADHDPVVLGITLTTATAVPASGALGVAGLGGLLLAALTLLTLRKRTS